MSIEYIRYNYGVPAKRGGRIEFTDSNGAKWRGTIRSSRDSRLRVSLDGLRTISILHPTWNMKYLTALKASLLNEGLVSTRATLANN